MLGSGAYSAFVYDRGGTQRLGELPNLITVNWQRMVDAVSQSTVVLKSDAQCCDFLGDIRSVRHEMVIYRNDQRIWEGPITRVVYGPETVEVQARDVLWWMDRRVHRGQFTDPINAVTEAQTIVRSALLYDDPNIYPFVQALPSGAPNTIMAVNRAEQTYLDSLDDLAEEGIHYTAVGRAILLWSANRKLGQTPVLRSGQDLTGNVNVIEDGLSLATRAVANGSDTFGATAPEPLIYNYATNPSLEINFSGYASPSKFWLVDRYAVGWGSGLYAGRVRPQIPVKPAASAAERVKRVYDKNIQDYNSSEVMMNTGAQRILVREGEQISATLQTRQYGSARVIIGLRLRGISDDGEVIDRAFAEGAPRWVGLDPVGLKVVGTVPEGVRYCFVELYRDTQKTKFTGASQGVQWDQFGLWRGRSEPWFDGNTPDTATFTHSWTGAPNASYSSRVYCCPKINDYYGLVEQLEDSQLKQRNELEVQARALLRKSYPSPLALDVPQNSPLAPTAPVEVRELVAGTTIPIETEATCRRMRADCLLSEVNGKWDAEGEVITITVISGQIWEIEEEEEVSG